MQVRGLKQRCCGLRIGACLEEGEQENGRGKQGRMGRENESESESEIERGGGKGRKDATTAACKASNTRWYKHTHVGLRNLMQACSGAHGTCNSHACWCFFLVLDFVLRLLCCLKSGLCKCGRQYADGTVL